jgi:hypothetical protein
LSLSLSLEQIFIPELQYVQRYKTLLMRHF